jgi:hypothetical protein
LFPQQSLAYCPHNPGTGRLTLQTALFTKEFDSIKQFSGTMKPENTTFIER